MSCAAKAMIYNDNTLGSGGPRRSLAPVAGTSNQLTLCNHWIQHTSVHCNKAHIGQ